CAKFDGLVAPETQEEHTMTTNWTRRRFTGTYSKSRIRRGLREVFISEIVDTSGTVEIDGLWIKCPAIFGLCHTPGVQIHFEADHRHKPRIIHHKLKN